MIPSSYLSVIIFFLLAHFTPAILASLLILELVRSIPSYDLEFSLSFGWRSLSLVIGTTHSFFSFLTHVTFSVNSSLTTQFEIETLFLAEYSLLLVHSP